MLRSSTMSGKMREGLVVTRRMRTYILVILCFLLTGFAVTAQAGRLVTEKVHSPSLEGNLFNDSPVRRVSIYLPPSYDDGNNLAYPVVYLLRCSGNPSGAIRSEFDTSDGWIVPEESITTARQHEWDRDLAVAMREFDDASLLVETSVPMLTETIDAFIII